MPADLIITPNRTLTGVPTIQFSGCSGTSLISLQVLQAGDVSFQGSQGQLFGISDSLTGVLMGVYDIAGLPIMEVSSNDMVTMGTYNSSALVVSGRRVGIGTASPAFTLDVTGATQLRNTLTLGSGIILPSSTATGGGIAMPPDLSVYRSLPGRLTLETSGSLSPLVRFSNTTTTRFGIIGLAGSTNHIIAGDIADDVVVQSSAGSLLFVVGGAGSPVFTIAKTAATANFSAGIVGNTSGAFRDLVTAKTYIIPPSGVATPVMLGNPATVSGALNIDVSAAGLQTVTITGNTLISGINHVAGGATTIRIYAATGGVSSIVQQLAFSTGWRFVSTMPTGLLINKALVLTVQCFDATDSGICVAAAVQS